MKRAAFILFILAGFLFLNPAPTIGQQKRDDGVKKRIRQVEHNLCSGITVEGEPNWTLAERMWFYHVKGVSIAVIKDYKIDWAKGYGWADSAEHRPVTTATWFQAGSMSKSLNALGVLKLVQAGKLNLSADINEYLTSWKFPYDSLSGGKKITLANLLSHTAGLNVHGFPGYERGQAIPTIEQVLDGTFPANTPAVRSLFAPSLKGQYSGGGTMIAQLIVQDVTKMPYDTYMRDNVLQPLQMTNSSFSQPPLEKGKLLATGYLVDGTEVQGKYHIYPEQAAAGLWTTSTDLAKYVIGIQRSLLGQSDKLLSSAMTRTMLTAYKNPDFGLGVVVDTLRGTVYFSHGGQDLGFVGRYFGSIMGGNGVVVMTNTDDDALVNEIINSVAVTYQWKGFYQPFMTLKRLILPDSLLQAFAGTYRVTATSEGQFNLVPGATFTVTQQHHHLIAQTTGGPTIAIYPKTTAVFFPRTSDTDITFTRDPAGQVTRLTIHQNGKRFDCEKIGTTVHP